MNEMMKVLYIQVGKKTAGNRNQAYAQRNAKAGRRNNKRLQSV